MARIRNVPGGAPGGEPLRWWPAGLSALLVPLAIWLGAAGLGAAGLEDSNSEVPAETGVTVQGTVVDAKTGKPVQGARVAPMVFRSPGESPDWDRKVETDADGKFTLQKVDGSVRIQVAHPDYYDFECDFINKGRKQPGEELYVVCVALKSGDKLAGVVKDRAGKPLAAVEVEDLAGKKTVSGEDGHFVLKSIKLNGDGKYYLTVTNTHGIIIEPREMFRGLNGGEYRFSGLWPGRWTLAVWSGKDRLASDQIDVQGEETISRVLTLDGNEKAEKTTLPQSEPKPDPSIEPMIQARFTARVEWLEIEGKRKAEVVPVENDPHWLVGIEILSVEKPTKPFDKKGKAVLLIHSPARLFAGEEAKAPGRTYSFQVLGTMRDGRPAFHSAHAEKQRKGDGEGPGAESRGPEAPRGRN